jgi:hypothetical protein
MSNTAVKIAVIESEAGWGRKIEDWMVCLSKEDAKNFEIEYNSKNKENSAPEWYMQVEGEALPIDLTNEQFDYLKNKGRVWLSELKKVEKYTLTDYQKEFILKHFFINEKYPGWKSIATALLEKGNCIVAGEKCIWIGGIGNFVKTKVHEEAIGCLLYTFNLNEFLSSKWYKEIKELILQLF